MRRLSSSRRAAALLYDEHGRLDRFRWFEPPHFTILNRARRGGYSRGGSRIVVGAGMGPARDGDTKRGRTGAPGPHVRSEAVARPGDSFVGRSAELDRIEQALSAGARVVTLLGTAGTGKTRLAIELAVRRAEAWFCDLTEARRLEDVCVTVARVFDVPIGGAASADDARPDEMLVSQLGTALAARGAILIVLDNAEHVVASTAGAVARWLRAAPTIQWVVTSREPLRIAGEVTVAVGLLPVPGKDELDPAKLAGFASVELLRDRAGTLGDPRGWAPEEAAAIAEIARRVEGIPLALELCAARLRTVSSVELVAVLSRQLDVLSHGRRDAPDRQATLRPAIRWSWDLLQPDERTALACCSVFRGGFSLDAASAVISAEHGGPLAALDMVQALHERSLVRIHHATGFAGERRYALYESVRELASEQLDELGLRPETVARHTAHFLAFGERTNDEVDGPRGIEARHRLALEAENLMAVYEEAVEQRAPRTALRVGLALQHVYRARGQLARYETMLAEVMDPVQTVADAAAASSEGPDDELLGRAYLVRGWALLLTGRVDRAGSQVEKAVACAERARNSSASGRALHVETVMVMGLCSALLGDATSADRCFAEARSQLDQEAPQRLLALWHRCCGFALARRGQSEAACRCFEDALVLAKATGDHYAQAVTLQFLGGRHVELARLDEARRYFNLALESFQVLEDRRACGNCLGALGLIEQERGQFDAARDHLERALAIHREVGDRHAAATSLARVAGLALERGDLPEARDELTTARCDAPGQALPTARIVEAGWPGERILPVAAANRAKVAIATLRRLGLRQVLQTRNDGYLLDPRVPVRFDRE